MARTALKIAGLVVAVFLAGAPVFAQRGGGRVTMSAPQGTQVVRVSGHSRASSSSGATSTFFTGGFGLSTVPFVGTPSPGFSFTHQAALNQNLAVKALIDPATQAQLALERQIRRSTPIVPIAPFFPTTTVIVVQQPPVVIINDPGSEPEAEDGLTLVAGRAAPRRARMQEPEPVETPRELVRPAEPAPPVPDLDEMVLVRRDGKLIFVVAFSAQGERVVYVTKEGHRRSMLLAELDSEATRAFNEERGVNVRVKG